jgi:hypothetical protein
MSFFRDLFRRWQLGESSEPAALHEANEDAVLSSPSELEQIEASGEAKEFLDTGREPPPK